MSQEPGAMLEYQGQTVSLLWQSKQAFRASALLARLFQAGSLVTGGFAWSRP
jgi:hypothetical protein